MKLIEIYTSPRAGRRLQIQIDGPEKTTLQQLIIKELNPLKVFLSGCTAVEKKRDHIDSLTLDVRTGQDVNYLLPADILADEEVIVTLSPSTQSVREVFAMRPIIDASTLLIAHGRCYFSSIYQQTSEIATDG